MRRMLLVAALATLAAAAPAHAGSSIKTVPSCDGQLADYSAKARADFREALLCILNSARKTYGLPALKRSAALEKAAQGHAASEAKHDYVSHTGRDGSSIASRIARRGYRAAAYNEALAGRGRPDDPYSYAGNLLGFGGHPCSAVFDPRFRDIGIGIERLGSGPVPVQFRPSFLVIDFGLRKGSKAPSTKTTTAKSCPHKLPRRPANG